MKIFNIEKFESFEDSKGNPVLILRDRDYLEELRIIVLGKWILSDSILINKMISTRNLNRMHYFQQEIVNYESTLIYLSQYVDELSDRTMLGILGTTDKYYGIFAFRRINKYMYELDAIMKFERTGFRMSEILAKSIQNFAESKKIIGILVLKVEKTNDRAIKLYKSIGFRRLQLSQIFSGGKGFYMYKKLNRANEPKQL